MPKQKPRWGFWIFWVTINSLASLFWALILDHSFDYLMGISAGVVCFIVFYAQFDHYLTKKHYHQAQRVLESGVYFKAGLQVLNVLIFPPIGIAVSPEVIAGSLALTAAESVGANSTSFIGAFIATLITGALLSVMVGILSIMAQALRRIAGDS